MPNEFDQTPYSLVKDKPAKEPKEKVEVTVEGLHQAVSDKPGFYVHGLDKKDLRNLIKT
jgi:hypothetical protein